MAKVLASSPAETLANASSRGGGGTCPVGFGSKPEACAGNDSLNKLNNMEAPNQQPAADQPYPLPKARVESTIPTAEGSNWVYPSEQVCARSLSPYSAAGPLCLYDFSRPLSPR